MKTLLYNGTRTKPYTALGADGNLVYVEPGKSFEASDADADTLLSAAPGLYIEVQPEPTAEEWLQAAEADTPKRKSKGN